MYRKDSEGWLKHADFIVLDMICLQLAFILAYAFRGYGFNVYGDILYRNMAIFLGFADLVVIFTSGTMKSVLKRGHYKEFVTTLKNAVAVGALAIAYLFIIQEGQSFSRMILITTIVIYLVLTYAIREIWKNSLHKKMENGGDKKLLIITSKAVAENVVHSMQENNYARYSLAGVVVIDEDCTGEKICGVPVVAGESDVPMYVCQEWIDEVLIVISEDLPYPDGLIDKLTETGVTVHLNLAKITNQTGKRQFVEKVGSYTVLTTSLNYASFGQLFLKRLMDICGGLVGCIFTGIITIFVGPAIYLASPGPIFFSQERVGKNGKKFKMYKFRSMYMNAEARKAELMKENKLGDGKMFKMDFDPRVIGNKVLPDGSHKTGVGDFIRRTSLDEFPQFFNVLKGDMSIVGTRPPLISETNLYEPRHKVRLAIKPGITGMWQVSGRSDITDFEEVVRLDKEYIENWDIGLDIKILLKTVMVVVKLQRQKKMEKHYSHLQRARINGTLLIMMNLRDKLLQQLNKMKLKIGDNTTILSNVRLAVYGSGSKANITIGNNCYIGFCFSALASVEANIEIGDNVLFASNVLVTNENHGINPESTTPYMDQKLSAQDVKIGNGCWIGEKVSILSGVTIGEKCIIGAGSIVTKSIPSYSIAVGNPARIIKQYNFYTKRWERYYGEDEKR